VRFLVLSRSLVGGRSAEFGRSPLRRLFDEINILLEKIKAVLLQPDHTDSVTGWFRNLGTSRHEDASKLLWDRYFARLARLAQSRLRTMGRVVVDGEDIAVNAFDSFFRGAADGRFDRLNSRDDLWRLLVTIALRKARNAMRDELRQKRGGLVEFDDPGLIDQLAAGEPSPEFAALVADESRRLIEGLSDDSHRQIVGLRLEGYSNEEIASKLDCSLRTVERKLGVIRMRWNDLGDK
jgi:RNA polymerase sigma factor (sigma-70 family)